MHIVTLALGTTDGHGECVTGTLWFRAGWDEGARPRLFHGIFGVFATVMLPRRAERVAAMLELDSSTLQMKCLAAAQPDIGCEHV